ncbi:MAG: hypothetical protein AAF493_21760, partial [Pseudomonadota bacterium]
ELSGTVRLLTGARDFTLYDARLVFEPRDDHPKLKYELYGIAQAPLGDFDVLVGDFGVAPRAAVGLVSRETLQDLLESDDNPTLPLAENYEPDENGDMQLAEPAYLFFHFETGLTLDIPLGEWLGFNQESDVDPFAFSVPGDQSVTFIIDPHDPYFFMSNDARQLVVDKADQQIERATLYQQAIEEQEREQQAQRDAENASKSNGESESAADNGSPGNGSPGNGSPDNAKNNNANPSEKDKTNDGDKDKGSALPSLGALAFSAHGGIPFEPDTVWGLPDDIGQFKGHLLFEASVPLYKFIELSGPIVAHASVEGFEMGGNGDVDVSFDLAGVFSFSFPLGNASAGIKVTDEQFVTYFSGINSPDYSFLPPIIPMVPDNTSQVAGVIDTDHPENTRLEAYGKFTYDTSGFTELTGVQLGNLGMTEAHVVIDRHGVRAVGRTASNILPNVKLGGEATVEVYFSPTNLQASFIEMTGVIDIVGVGLKPARIRIGGSGIFIDGTFVTPLSTIEVSGTITAAGPALSGSAEVIFPLGDFMDAVNQARAGVIAAQGEVEKWDVAVLHMRSVVKRERDEAQAKLNQAIAGMNAAQSHVNKLNAQIGRYNRSISSAKSAISSKYRWYKRQKWYKKAWAWGKYTAYRVYQYGRIAYYHSVIAGIVVARTAANLALETAKLTVAGLRSGLDITPIDLDPRVAGLIISLEAAEHALKLAELALPPLPSITADIAGEIELGIDLRGARGELSATFNGHPVTSGHVNLGPKPQACVSITPLGNVCLAI